MPVIMKKLQRTQLGRSSVLSAPVVTLVAALFLIFVIAPQLDPILELGLLMIGTGLIGAALLLSLGLMWPDSKKKRT